MATRAGSFAEPEALKLAFSYLANSIDAAALLPAAMSRQLITERQRSECASELDPYKKAELFLSHLQRAVNGDYIKFHAFVQVLHDTGQPSIAWRLHDELTHATRSMHMQSTTTADSSTEGAHVVVPDELVEELADLRVAFAKLLRNYEKELLNSSEAQAELVALLPRLFRKGGSSSDLDFKSNFNKLVEEKVSLFNIHYLKNIRSIFPEDVCAATRKLVDQYEQQYQHFMTGTTVSQFKKLFPASATPYKLSTEKVPVKLKLQKEWDSETLDDLTKLVNLFGVAGDNLHLSKVQEGCIAVTWLCSTADVKNLKVAIFEAADSLQTRGVLQVFVGEELMWELYSQPKQVTESHAHKPVTLHLVNETEIDYLCPICTEPLTEPFHTDCGHFLCHNCHDLLLSMNKTECPTCREPDTLSNARLFKYHQRMVNSLKVYCPDYKEGCEWMGELRHLSDHLDPNKGRCGIACVFGCGTYDHRPEMKEHKKHHCRKRPTTCEYCGYHNTHDIVTEKHYPVCLRYPKEQIINQAVAITPPPATVSPQYLYNLPPVVFTITDYQEMKQANKVWFSPPYYTHTRGYKFCLKVYPNGAGSGKGTHISVYAYLMRGEYDNELEWPFEGDINVEVCNWREDENHILETIHLNRYTDEDGTRTSRVMNRETAGTGYGYHMFISHTDLAYNSTTNTEYLHDDCLQVRVCDVAVYSITGLLHKTPSWQDPLTTTQSVCEFTLTEFSKRKQFNNQYISPPFYTHPQGYKLCLVVHANSFGRGEGTHVSIGVQLMRGEHDQHLHWPFIGDIIFELLNWREDKKHYKKTFSAKIPDNYIQVVNGLFGQSISLSKFIHADSLSYNSTTNTEYLQEDCLRLRVSDVIFYSTALLHKTPSWQDPLTTTQSVSEFTLTEFSKRKQFNNEYYSPPFYTHPQGYKLCLRVHANGDGSGKDTHVSIFATLLEGEHDQHLQWPFTGDIIIELLNWREDNEHHKMTVKIIKSHGFAQAKGMYGKNWGYHQFISHSSLPYNSTTNTEYLQEDCLRLRVNVSNIK